MAREAVRHVLGIEGKAENHRLAQPPGRQPDATGPAVGSSRPLRHTAWPGAQQTTAHSRASAAEAKVVRVVDGQTVVTDGPFAETKEQVGGYDVIDCSDLDEAIEIASKHPSAWYGTIEVRPIAGEHCQDFD